MAAPQAINSLSDLTQSLETEATGFQEFIQILKNEQEALIQGEVDQLLELARLKSDKTVQLFQLAERRSRFLSAQGHGSMEQCLNQLGADDIPRLSSLWKHLLDAAKEAQHLNQTNGVMIETRLQHNQQALAVLQAAACQSSVYGPDGQPQSPGLGRPLGKV